MKRAQVLILLVILVLSLCYAPRTPSRGVRDLEFCSSFQIEPPQRKSQTLTAPLPEGSYRSAQGFKETEHYPNLFHLGKDYCVDASADMMGVNLSGTRFYALGLGTVVDVRFSEPAHRSDGVGNYISIDHGNRLVAVYMHLAKVFVKPGQVVDSNTPLGEAGDVILHPRPNCGHLHLEIRNNGGTGLKVPPNLRYSYASRDGTTTYSRPLGDERAVNAWMDSNFLDPDQVVQPRQVAMKPGAVVRNQLGMELVYVPSGSFMMGSNHFTRWETSEGKWAIYEKPVHQVTIKEGFYMGRYEVTQAEWQRVMGANPSYVKGENLPVEMVTWEEVQSFLKKLNERRDGFRYRLPSEAEWEYACRAGMTGDYPEDLEDVAWYANNSGKTSHPVGTKQANAFGLYDMLGNVWEWCEDIFHPTYDGAPIDGSPWLSGKYSNIGTKEANLYRRSRVWRGGSWNWGVDSARCASRNYYFLGAISPHQGFRVVAISRVISRPAKDVTKRSGVVRRSAGSGSTYTWSSNSRIVFERWLKCSEEENRRSGTVGDAWGCSVELWAIRSDSSDPQRLTYGAKDTDPAWSPDGQNIAFSRSNHENGIYVIARGGTNLRRLTSVTEGDFGTLCPQWAQDDQLIFSFTSEREPGWNLHSVRVDGHDEQVIKVEIANPFCPRVSPNRRQVAFN